MELSQEMEIQEEGAVQIFLKEGLTPKELDIARIISTHDRPTHHLSKDYPAISRPIIKAREAIPPRLGTKPPAFVDSYLKDLHEERHTNAPVRGCPHCHVVETHTAGEEPPQSFAGHSRTTQTIILSLRGKQYRLGNFPIVERAYVRWFSYHLLLGRKSHYPAQNWSDDLNKAGIEMTVRERLNHLGLLSKEIAQSPLRPEKRQFAIDEVGEGPCVQMHMYFQDGKHVYLGRYPSRELADLAFDLARLLMKDALGKLRYTEGTPAELQQYEQMVLEKVTHQLKAKGRL